MLPHIDISHLITTIGYIGIFGIIFAETGLFFGFFLPGDSLLFTAGLLASQGIFHLGSLVTGIIICAISGYMLAFWLGERLGLWLLKRPDSFWFKKDYLLQAEKFYTRHGGKALIIGRLIPIVRTFVPIVAGMANMNFYRYCMYNLIGALVWGGGLTLLGYYLGNLLPDAERYVLLVVALIIILSIIPILKYIIKGIVNSRKN